MEEADIKRMAYRKLAQRGYYSRELAKVLVDKGAPPESLTALFAELTRLGYLNDAEWVAGAVRSLVARKYGPKAIAYKLSLKGVPEEEFAAELSKLLEGEGELIRRLLLTRYKSHNLRDFKVRQKVTAALARKGFGLSAIISTLQQFSV